MLVISSFHAFKIQVKNIFLMIKFFKKQGMTLSLSLAHSQVLMLHNLNYSEHLTHIIINSEEALKTTACDYSFYSI